MRDLPRVVHLLACVVIAVCVAVLGSFVVFDTQLARLTTGRVPSETAPSGGTLRLTAHRPVLVVAHNAGDELSTAARAVAWGAGAIEIDVRSSDGELLATHDPQSALLEDLFYRGPSLGQAWGVAALRGTVLLHLKQHAPRYLARVRAFVRAQPPRRLIVQTADVATLRWAARELPSAERLLLVFGPREMGDIGDPAVQGVSVRDRLASDALLRGVHARGLREFVWSVDDPARVQHLLDVGVDGIITDRLDVMRALRGR